MRCATFLLLFACNAAPASAALRRYLTFTCGSQGESPVSIQTTCFKGLQVADFESAPFKALGATAEEVAAELSLPDSAAQNSTSAGSQSSAPSTFVHCKDGGIKTDDDAALDLSCAEAWVPVGGSSLTHDTCVCPLHFWCGGGALTADDAAGTVCLSDPYSASRHMGAAACAANGAAGANEAGAGPDQLFDDTCFHSNDGTCDEANEETNGGMSLELGDVAVAVCATGTDCTDCGTCPKAGSTGVHVPRACHVVSAQHGYGESEGSFAHVGAVLNLQVVLLLAAAATVAEVGTL